MEALQKVQVARVGALIIALMTVVSCYPSSSPKRFSPNGSLTIADGRDSNSHAGGNNAHSDRNDEGDNETTGILKKKRYKVNDTLPNTSVDNGGDSNGDKGVNDTHGINHDEDNNETVFGSSTSKGTSGTSALASSSAILVCFFLASGLVITWIT